MQSQSITLLKERDMDESYIKMWWKATEIQKQKRPGHPEDWKWGDIYSDGEHTLVVVPDHFPIQGYIWLPRQDDLQAMLSGSDWGKASRFYEFIWGRNHKEITEYAEQFLSMEQLWLAFVMKELYHKQWYNGEWREEDDRYTERSSSAPQRR